jgi:hypothetical protein
MLSPLHEEHEEPTYRHIQQVHIELNANSSSVQSYSGDGQLGLLKLTVTDVQNEARSIGGVPCILIFYIACASLISLLAFALASLISLLASEFAKLL